MTQAQQKRQRKAKKSLENARKQAWGRGRWTNERFWKNNIVGPWLFD